MTERASSAAEKATQSRYSLMQTAAAMEDVISFGAGDPDLHTAPQIIRNAVSRMAAGPCLSPPRGLPELRSALARHYSGRKCVDFDPESEILITNGAQEALFLSMMALVNPGDGVLIADPRYSSYDQAIEAAGGVVVPLRTGDNHRFELEPSELLDKAGQGKLLISVNPNNPTGALLLPDAVRRISKIAQEAGLLAVSDEVYEGLVFNDAAYLSMVQCDGMRDRTVTLSSFSKTYAMTGFRVGYLIGPPAFVDAVARLKEITSGPCPAFSQHAALAALTGSQGPAEEIRMTFARRRAVMMDGLNSLDIPYGYPGGTFFVWADISRFELPAEEFCRRLLERERVLLFPGTAFGARWQGYVRISILQPEARIEEGLARMRRFLQTLHTPA
jgi:aminotransferase